MTPTKDNEEYLYAHSSVPKYMKPQYEALIGTATVEDFINDLKHRASQIVEILGWMGFTVDDFNPGDYEGIGRYALEGNPEWFLKQELRSSGLIEDFGNLAGLREIFGCFQEITSGPGESPYIPYVTNLAAARMELDMARLGKPDCSNISLMEISLLAGMKERSVRNYAIPGSKNYLQTIQGEKYTSVKPDIAHEWLLSRRKYRPTELPESKDKRTHLLQYFADDF